MNFLKFFALVVVLNLVRYFVGGPIEGATIFEPMHAVMPKYPEVFDNNFTAGDFCISLGYNFVLWFAAAAVFHLLHPGLKGPWVAKGLQSYGLMCLFFISLAAVYMNHFTNDVKPFFLYSMADAVMLFAIVGVAHGLLHPWFFRSPAD